MNYAINLIVRSSVWSLLLLLCLFAGQSTLANTSGLSNDANVKATKSADKKPFSRSKPFYSKKSGRRSSSENCVQWNAIKINDKASKYNPYIDKYARQYRIDKNLIKAVITAESCFKVKALSNKGAQGLMQLIPATAKRFGVKDSYKPKQNIRGGTSYLRFLMDHFKGDLKKVIASYNAGESAVEKYKGIPPFKETKQYVKNVLRVYSVLNPGRVKDFYYPPIMSKKAGRQGWQYNRSIAPHLYKK